MGKRRTISYEATARLAVAGGAVALATVAGTWATAQYGPVSPVVKDALSLIGVAAWFVGTAAGVLSLSTPHARTGMAGLALSALALAVVLGSRIVGS